MLFLVCGKQSDRSGLREGGLVGNFWEGRLVGEVSGWEFVAVTCHMGTSFTACQYLPARPHGLPEQYFRWELSAQVHGLMEDTSQSTVIIRHFFYKLLCVLLCVCVCVLCLCVCECVHMFMCVHMCSCCRSQSPASVSFLKCCPPQN